ncbi:MAG TPA: flagellar filament capping protein FliD [Clostridia bacterium]|nr:flagellar filament capping protein FliD [Clostridia bacterium]HXK71483.1 flagellar filament capping protein FliD [Clostridia bacterium]
MTDQVSSLKYSSSKISGLASGLDTEAMIESLMKVERQKVIKIEQELEYTTWQQDAYRDVIHNLSDFTKSQFNISDNSKNILSTTNLKSVNIESSEYASILANGDANIGDYTINEIVSVAKAATISSSSTVKNGIQGNKDLSLMSSIDVEGMSFYARLDGEQYEISFSQNYTDTASLVSDIQSQFDNIFGAGRVTAGINVDGALQFNASGSILQIIDNIESDTKLEYIGLRSGDMSILNLRGSLSENFGYEENVSFSINGTEFNFTYEDSIENIMKTVNESTANVKMTYSSITDKITISSTKTGSNAEIDIQNLSGNFFGPSGIVKIDQGITKNGQDAMFYLNDESKENLIIRSSNTFTIDNVTYTLKEETVTPIDFKVENNEDGVFESIKSFIEEYNSIVEELTSHVTQKRDYDYEPLSDEQKKEMSEDQIADWEEKAKQGLLKADNTIYSMLNELRTAFITGVENISMTFGSIGINTSSYTNNGIITIDETVLKGAISGKFDDVVSLFTRESSISYLRDLSSEDAAERFDESGFCQRVNDIVKKYITTARDKNGNKGLLVEKAGIENDASEGTNALTRKIDEIKERLDRANDLMDKKERGYWSQFSNLEVAINKLNTQSGYVSSMMEQ